MTAPEFAAYLKKHRACHEAVEWAKGKTLAEAWAECGQGDWMLWLAERAKVDRKVLVLAACDCARMALKHAPAGEERPRNAIEVVEAWCRGEATLDEVRAAAAAAANAAAYAAAAYAAAAAAANAAAYAAAYAAAAAAAAAYAAYAAAAAAAADAAYAADAAAYAAAAAARRKMSVLVRSRIPLALIEKAIGGGK